MLGACSDPEGGGERGVAGTSGSRDAGPDAAVEEDASGGRGGADACADLACDRDATCDDEGGSPKCTCNDGFTGDGMSCEDIDECASAADNDCDENAVCANRPGGYVCVCPDGATDASCGGIDECQGATNTCDPNATCTDTVDAFDCMCGEGYTGDGFGCADADECASASTFECADDASCQNIFGGYECACDPGFGGDGKTGCQDLCEIALADAAVCAANGLCHIADGEAACGACALGYTGDGKSCDDDTSACPSQCDGEDGDDVEHSICTGGACECAPGYEGDPTSGACTDADECAAADCGDHADCVELAGAKGYVCKCREGYRKDAAGACVDIDECATPEQYCHPNASCENSAGGFSCACKEGYSGDGSVCRDVNECVLGDDNCLDDGTAACVNTRGSFECRCRRGYTGDGVTSCTNLDECASDDANDCDANATCTDKTPEEDPLGYVCSCAAGFSGDGFKCTSINECNNAALNDCEGFSKCVDEPEGYSCQCLAPFTGTPEAGCYCDLSGYWAMRQDVDTCWAARSFGAVDAIKAGTAEANVWELHRLTYDGNQILVEKMGCATDNYPDLVSPANFFDETYSSYIPDEALLGVGLQPGQTIPQAGIVPGSMFTTPSEAAVGGMDIGDDPVNAVWPATHDLVNGVGGAVPAWTDDDDDGQPGVSVWPYGPNDTTEAGRKFSYVPVTVTDQSGTLVITERAGCVSVATRVITHLDADVVSCTRIVGDVTNEKTEGRVHSCVRVAMEDWDQGSPDVDCNTVDWDGPLACTEVQVGDLDDQDQSSNSTATFEMIKIGELADTVDCDDAVAALPPISHAVPTITCQ